MCVFLAKEARLFVLYSFPALALGEHLPVVSFNALLCALGFLHTGSRLRRLIRCRLDQYFWQDHMAGGYVPFCQDAHGVWQSPCLDVAIDRWVQELSA